MDKFGDNDQVSAKHKYSTGIVCGTCRPKGSRSKLWADLCHPDAETLIQPCLITRPQSLCTLNIPKDSPQ